MKNELLKIIGFLCLIATLLVQISCDRKEKTQTQSSITDEIQDLLAEYHNQGLFDGTVLIADEKGIVYQGAIGMADRGKKIPLTLESQFYLASVSKQFTASAILLLIQQGKISPDEKVVNYMPELPGIFKDITIRQLLNHTSGLPDYYEFTQPFDGFTNDDVLEVLLSIDSLEFEPGSQFKYSNSGYVLLSILVDRVSGLSFADFLYENAFKKAGLKQTVVFDQYAESPAKRVIGYGNEGATTDYRFRTTGGGGIFSNVEDLYTWHLTLSSNQLLKEDIIDLAYQPTILKNDSIVYYGFGWYIDPENSLHVSHQGELEGFRTLFDRKQDSGHVIILLSNNSSQYLGEIAEKIWRLWPDDDL